MKNYKTVLFDFDGTLFNTSPGVFASFDEVVSHYGLNIDKSIYNNMIGPPLKFSFVHYLGLPESEVPAAINVYRESYTKNEGMFNCTVYPGVVELIKKLKRQDLQICVATSKPEDYAKAILERNNMLDLFDFTGGSDMEEKYRVEKVDVVKYVLKSMNLDDKKDSVLMIGDRLYDVNGAHSAGLKCMGILWGFGSRKEFDECGADYVCESPDDVYNFLCS
ncbi:MAG: HAD hydrolase-like protein [Treponema sp.]|nr:HAD hydrolase-like protein [Treponema sp.]